VSAFAMSLTDRPVLMQKLVISPALDETRWTALQAAAVELEVVNCASQAEALAHMPEADAFFGRLTPELLRPARRLQWVQAPTASLEHYLFPELIAHPLCLTNMRGIFSDVVAEHALGLLFSISRNLHIYARQQAQRIWSPAGGESERSDFITGPGLVSEIDRRHRTLQGATLGIIGCGGIGSALARKAASLGMQILALDRQALSLSDVPGEVWPPERLPELLRLSDYICIAAPHTPETQHLIRRPQLRQMRPTAWLLNVGRGSIVALEDLTQALHAGELAGAALDVLEVEPLPADHPLWTLPNVILTPHVAAADIQVPQRHLQLLLENVRRFSTGQPLLNIVQKQLWH